MTTFMPRFLDHLCVRHCTKQKITSFTLHLCPGIDAIIYVLEFMKLRLKEVNLPKALLLLSVRTGASSQDCLAL